MTETKTTPAAKPAAPKKAPAKKAEKKEETLEDKRKKANEFLASKEPMSISEPDRKGYVGYSPQYVVDAMNYAFGLGGWGFEEIDNEAMHQPPDSKIIKYISHLRVEIKEGDRWLAREAWGEGTQPRGNEGDARKAAQTDAMKKALSYFSIGNKAYHGLLKKNVTIQHGNNTTENPPAGH